MKFWTAVLVGVLSLGGAAASAQEMGPGPGTAEVTLIPGGAMFFVGGSTEESFANYNLGGAFTYNVNQYVGLEAELGGTLGFTQNLTFGGMTTHQKSPDTFGYTGNVVISEPMGHGLVPYITGGIGGLTMLQNSGLAITNDTTFFTGNFGAGLKWYANDRVGFRADYRLTMVQSRDSAPQFFGHETRYGNRVYGALILNVVP